MIRLKKNEDRLSKNAVFLHVLVLLSYIGLAEFQGPLRHIVWAIVLWFPFFDSGISLSIVFFLQALFFIVSLFLNMKTLRKFLTSLNMKTVRKFLTSPFR